MDQLTEQSSLFELPTIETQISPDVVLVEVSTPPKSKQDTVGPGNPGLAARFEEMADKMQATIDGKLSHDRLTNTPKRMAQAMSARVDGERLARTQQALRILARMHRAGDCPGFLAKLKSKKAVHDLMGSELTPCSNGFHTYYSDTGKPRPGASAESIGLWAFIEDKSPEQEKADRIAQLERDLQFSQIPGYFPTPDEVIETMLDYAQIEAHHSILEPSAGAGAIIDGIVARHGDGPLIAAYEINASLCEILQAKGFDARPVDFLEAGGMFAFDRVLMNPPFENLQDIEHVMAAFKRLKSGGRLVSVMSPGPFFRDTGKAKGFRMWLDELGGEAVDLPEGSFKESGTGVASKLVIIDKE
jgi:hypothetical protein